MSTAASSGSTGAAEPARFRPRLRDWPMVGAKILAIGVWTTALATLLVASWLPTLVRPRSGPARRARTRRRFFRLWGRGMMRVLGVRVTTVGNAPPPGVLVVSNHLSYLDIVALASVVPMVFVAKAEIRRWPFWGPMAALGGTVFVDRSRKRDVISVLGVMCQALDRGDTVIVFPEATSTQGATILPLKPALLAAAAASRDPVYWLTVTYRTPPGSQSARDRVCWWGDVGFVPHCVGLFALTRVHCTIRFGSAPIRSADRKALAAALRSAMLRRFEPVAGGVDTCDAPG